MRRSPRLAAEPERAGRVELGERDGTQCARAEQHGTRRKDQRWTANEEQGSGQQRPDENGGVLEVADQDVCRSELFGRGDQTGYRHRVRRTNEGHEGGGRGDRHDDQRRAAPLRTPRTLLLRDTPSGCRRRFQGDGWGAAHRPSSRRAARRTPQARPMRSRPVLLPTRHRDRGRRRARRSIGPTPKPSRRTMPARHAPAHGCEVRCEPVGIDCWRRLRPKTRLRPGPLPIPISVPAPALPSMPDALE